MIIGIVDVVIICLVLSFAISGLKNGFFKHFLLFKSYIAIIFEI